MLNTLQCRLFKKVQMQGGEEARSEAELPKTRSGKIMRRLLRDIAEGRALGDTTTLADPNVVAALEAKYEEE